MVLALYVVAGVMVVGGLAAVYSGSDIIVMERGWTMVIAGSVMAASGALLAGIATAVARLQDLQSDFARLSERLGRPQAPAFAPEPSLEPRRGPVVEPPSPPPVVAPDISRHRDLEIAPEPIFTAPPAPERAAGPLPGEPPPVREPPPMAAERELPPPEPVPPAAPAEEAEEPSVPTVVGTYNSGGNFYIMYSDGSIEAETPAGKFRFDSLDELKEFIAAGGDKAKATS